MNSSRHQRNWGSTSWLASELDEIVETLIREYPDKSEEELVHAVVFCKGAVQRDQGFQALQSFVSRLLHNTQLARAQPQRERGGVPPGGRSR